LIASLILNELGHHVTNEDQVVIHYAMQMTSHTRSLEEGIVILAHNPVSKEKLRNNIIILV
jgi:hypothetical protein